MKKLLALVLALVMTLGLATVSTSAAYSDADDINYDEAVAVMSAIGVFQGKGSNFDPKANLNRAEAAKVVAYLMVGNKTAENLQGSGTKFTDVPASHWASGYIEYLASVGVVSGVGDNKFDPNGQVTAIQLAKMLLVALGYDAKIEGMVGSDWSINIQKLANKVGIFDGNKDVVGTAAVSRDEAALYSFNTIKSPLVEYDNNVTVDLNGNGSVTVGRNKAEYITSAKRADQTVSYETDTETGAWLVEFAERYYSDLKLETRQTNGDDYDLDDFGRPSREWTYKNDKVGEYSANTYLVAEFTAKVTPKKVYDAIGKTAYDNLNDGKSDLFVTRDGNKIVTNSVVTETTLAANIDSYANRTNDDSTVNSSGNGALTQVFMNDDNDVYIATINTYVLQATSDYSASSQELIVKAVGDTNIALKSYKLSAQDLDVQDFKKDDYILATAYATSNGTYEVDSVAKAELLTGEVNNWKSDDNVTLDGTTYKYSNTAKKSTDVGHVNDVKSTNYTVGQKAIVVLDKYGYIIAIDEAVVDENYVFVSTFGTTSGINTNVVADAYFPDGTNKEITVKKVAGNDSKNTSTGMAAQSGTNTTPYGVIKKAGVTGATKTSLRAGWYTYSVDSDGQYTLRNPSGDYKQTALLYAPQTTTNTQILTNNKVSFLANAAGGAAANTEFVVSDDGTNSTGVNGTAVYANDKTVFIVATDDDVYTYVGVKNVPDLTIGNTTGYNATTNPMGGAALGDTNAAVFAVYKGTSSGYANYVFVTYTDENANNTVNFTDSSNTALFYVLKEEGSYTTKDNKNYYKYDVIDENGSKITVEASDEEPFGGNGSITGNNTTITGIYSAFYKTSKNADDRYSRATNLTTSDDGKYFRILRSTSQIDYDNGTLTIGGVKFTLAEDYKLTLVSLKTPTSYLNTSKGADYEITPSISAATLESRLKPLYDARRTVTYTIQGRTDDSYTAGNTVLKEAYITILDDGIAAPTTTTTVSIADSNGGTGINAATTTVNGTAIGTYAANSTTVNKNATSIPVTIKAAGNYIITNVAISGSGASIVSGSIDANGDWSGVISVGTAAVTLTATTKASVKLAYTAKQSVIVTEAGGSAVPMTATSASQTMSAKSQGEAITFTVQWGGSVEDWNKVVRYSDGTAIAPFDTQANTYTYSIAADPTPAKATIIIGAESYALTVPTGLTATWTNTTPTATANKNAFLAETSGIAGNGAARQVPYGANVVLTVTDVPTDWAKYTVTHSYSTYATTNPNAADAIINATHNAVPASATFTTFAMPQGNDAVTLTTATAAVRIPYAGITVAKTAGNVTDALTAWTASSTNVSVASGFADATYIYLAATTTRVTLSGIVLANGASSEKTTLTATGTATPAVVRGVGDVDSAADTITYNAAKTTGYSVVMTAGTATSGEVATLGVTLSDWA